MPWSSAPGWNTPGWGRVGGAPNWVPSIGGTTAAAFYDFTTNQGWSNNTILAASTSDLAISRASSGYDLLGSTSFSSGAFRRTAAGLLVEESRVNVVLWNRDLTNAAWTKTNCTAALDQTANDGTVNGASSLTATAGNATCLQSITLASSARLQSALVKRITGSGVVNMTTDGGTTWTPITLTGSWSVVKIPSQTLANPSVGFQIVTSGDAIAVDLVQNQNGAFVTSPIATTSASVLRALDVVTLGGQGLVAMQNAAFTVIAETAMNGGVASGRLVGTSAGVGGRAALYLNSPTTVGDYDGVTIDTPTLGSAANFFTGTVKSALASDGSSRELIGQAGTSATRAASIGAVTAVNIGNDGGAAEIASGNFRKITIYTRKLTGAELITVTT